MILIIKINQKKNLKIKNNFKIKNKLINKKVNPNQNKARVD